MSSGKMRKCILYFDKAVEPMEGDEKIGSGTKEKMTIIMSVSDFEKKLALMSELADTTKLQQKIQYPYNQWWDECERNAKRARDFFYDRYKMPLNIQEGGVEIHSLPLPMITGAKPFELVVGRLRGELGGETFEWPIRGYGYTLWHLYWLGECSDAWMSCSDALMSDVCVNRAVVWHETGWDMRGELWLCLHDLNLISSVTATVDFTATSIFSPKHEEIKIRASLNVLPERIAPRHRVDERWRVKQIQLSGVDISAKELEQRLGLRISPGKTKKKLFLTNSVVKQVRSAVSRLDCLLKDKWEETYSSCQMASARIKQHFS